MEEQGNQGDLLGHVIRPPSLRTGSLKATLSGRLTPRSSPSFRRSQSSRTPRKDVRVYAGPFQWFRGRRLLPWLVMIGIWSYVGFHIQSKWAHSGGSEGHTAFGSRVEIDQDLRSNILHEDQAVLTSNSSERVNKEVTHVKMPKLGIIAPVNLKKWFWKENQGLEKEKALNKPNNLTFGNMNLVLNSSGNLTFSVDHFNTSKNVVESSPNQTVHVTVLKRPTHSFNGSEGRDHAIMGGSNPMLRNVISETEEVDVTVKKNTSFGLLVGPFDKTENKVLGWNPGKRYGTCNRKGLFANTVRGRSFIVVLHELSMTGAPLAMMELASEILSCGGRVSAIALSRKGGLTKELLRRGIKLLKDKSVQSFRAAMKVDLVIAGSAVSALWIERYLLHHKRGSDRLIWWVMENRREYFDRSKHILHKVKALLFLSEIQSQKWMTWCAEEGIKLPSILEVVPLSVNDELAFVAGLQTALNSPLFSVDKMLKKRKALREEVRQSMGLDSNDMLVMTLSSINPGKGQLILLKAALTIVDENFVPKINADHIDSIKISRSVSGVENSIKGSKGISRVLSEFPNITEGGKFHLNKAISFKMSWNQHSIRNSSSKTIQDSSHSEVLERGQPTRKLLAGFERNSIQTLKLLIGSVGSKSNKVPYMKSMLGLIAHHPKLARLMLWTSATIHVAPLYAAADVYVINAQGIGETFGRVTIEAMAFGLPILGTDAGGTKEIVEDNITGLLHPVGQNGIQILSQHLHFLLDSQTVREEMGQKGREKVEKLFLKHHMYDKIGEILHKCMRYV